MERRGEKGREEGDQGGHPQVLSRVCGHLLRPFLSSTRPSPCLSCQCMLSSLLLAEVIKPSLRPMPALVGWLWWFGRTCRRLKPPAAPLPVGLFPKSSSLHSQEMSRKCISYSDLSVINFSTRNLKALV